MDLRGLANDATSTINPNEFVTIKSSNGYTVGAGARQIPSYVEASGYAQIQALDGDDLKQLDNISQQGVLRAIYLRGALHGIIRPYSLGGDLVTRADGSTWLVTNILETWPDWTKAVITLQKAP